MSGTRRRGYLQIYTGNGKGKTTAALGLAVRAAGNGHRVYIGQFMKGRTTGELKALKKLGRLVTIEQFGSPRCLSAKRGPGKKAMTSALSGLQSASRALASGKYDLVVLDEINVAVKFGLLDLKTVQDLVQSRPKAVELVMTGRYADAALIRMADLVTEMKEVKHYYHQGVRARKGIEE